MLGLYRPGSLLPGALPGAALDAPPGDRSRSARRDAPDPALAGRDRRERPRRRQVREPQPRARGGTGRARRLDDRGRRRRGAAAGFLDRLLGVCERLRARPRPARPDAAQPLRVEGHPAAARRAGARSPASSRSARSRPSGREPPAELLPFPELRFGWGLDLHWAALAAERGWRLGVVDAVPGRHEARTVAAGLPARRGRARRRRASWPSAPTCRARAPATRWPSTAGRRAAMRLLFVCPDMRTGGAERHWATLVPALHDRGVEAGVLCLDRRGAVLRRADARGRAGGRLHRHCAGAPTWPAGAARSPTRPAARRGDHAAA